MADSLTGNVNIEANWIYSKADTLGETATQPGNKKYEQAFASGTADNQADVLYAATRTVTVATTADDLDLAGALTDIFGDTITMVKIRAIVIKNKVTTSGEDLSVGAAASNPITDLFSNAGTPGTSSIDIKPGGTFAITAGVDGITVTAGSADTLRVNHEGSAADISYDIVIYGTTA